MTAPSGSRRERYPRFAIRRCPSAVGPRCAKICCRPAMRKHAGPAIEVQPRLATLIPDRWPAEVIPREDELLSSWLHRLALAHGLSPRHFGDCLGFGAGAWSARLDLEAPATLLNLLQRQTGVCRDRIAAMPIGARDWRPLLLPLRHSAGLAQAGQTRATWLQFCPVCLADDEVPYFRRAWRRATVMICRRHGRRLSDHCPACRQGLAPFNQRVLASQCQCAVCGFDLRRARAPKLAAPVRKVAEMIDDLVRIEAAKGFLGGSALTGRLLALPSLQDSAVRPEIHEFVDGRAAPLPHAARVRLRPTMARGPLRRSRDCRLAPGHHHGGWDRCEFATFGAPSGAAFQ